VFSFFYILGPPSAVTTVVDRVVNDELEAEDIPPIKKQFENYNHEISEKLAMLKNFELTIEDEIMRVDESRHRSRSDSVKTVSETCGSWIQVRQGIMSSLDIRRSSIFRKL